MTIKAVVLPIYLLYNYQQLLREFRTRGTVHAGDIKLRAINTKTPVFLVQSIPKSTDTPEEKMIHTISGMVAKKLHHPLIHYNPDMKAKHLGKVTRLHEREMLYLDIAVLANDKPESLFWSEVSICEIPADFLSTKISLSNMVSYARRQSRKYVRSRKMPHLKKAFPGALKIKNEIHNTKQYAVALFRSRGRAYVRYLDDEYAALQRKQRFFKSLPVLLHHKQILDIGCDTGMDVKVMLAYGEVMGIDDHFDEMASLLGIETKVRVGDVRRFKFGQKQYDILTLLRPGPVFPSEKAIRFKIGHSPDWTRERCLAEHKKWKDICTIMIPCLLRMGGYVISTQVSPIEHAFFLEELKHNFTILKARKLKAAKLYEKLLRRKVVHPLSPYYTQMRELAVPKVVDLALEGNYLIIARLDK
ncbi:class I SAM-dependent methyltransferase [Candidatus Woesearchaeota archaeon]|nr:class I SAM-dependent methyltransferase [Candidatus Woesearchaeota archaeon]